MYTIAAGNDAADACGYTPARTPNALTVGASDETDLRALYSNNGPCIDIFAPGNQGCVRLVVERYGNEQPERLIDGRADGCGNRSDLSRLKSECDRIICSSGDQIDRDTKCAEYA